MLLFGTRNNGFDGGLFTSIIIANSPQLLLSIIYLSYNSLLTCMLLAKEWSSYAHNAKPLRVTNPAGKQRSTYRLSLPYRYSIPLLLTSGVLHWLISQSISLVRIKAYNVFSDDGSPTEDPRNQIMTCGFSALALLASASLGGVVALICVALGFQAF